MANEEATVESAGAGEAKKKSPMLLIAIIAVMMILEGVGIFVFVAMTSKGPNAATASTLDGLQPEVSMAELLLIEDKFNNATDGRTHRFEVEIFLKVREENKEFVEKRLESRKHEIRDRVGQILRTTQVSQLLEPDLRTLRRQLLVLSDELFEIDGDDNRRVEQIIIARCMGTVVN